MSAGEEGERKERWESRGLGLIMSWWGSKDGQRAMCFDIGEKSQ